MYEIVAGIDTVVDRADSQAAAIAEMPLDRDAVRVTLVHCFADNTEGAAINQLQSVRAARRHLEARDVTVDLREASGDDPARRLLETAEELGADLIAVAGRKRSPAKKALFGSVSQEILLGTDRPVLVCGEVES